MIQPPGAETVQTASGDLSRCFQQLINLQTQVFESQQEAAKREELRFRQQAEARRREEDEHMQEKAELKREQERLRKERQDKEEQERFDVARYDKKSLPI